MHENLALSQPVTWSLKCKLDRKPLGRYLLLLKKTRKRIDVCFLKTNHVSMEFVQKSPYWELLLVKTAS